MKNNKLFKLFVAVLLSICMFIFFQDGYAEEDSSLEILTPTVPSEIFEFSEKDFGNMFRSILFFEKNKTNINEYQLGSPFTMFDQGNPDDRTYYFPVSLNDNIQYLYSVRKDTTGEYVSSISKFLADKLNEVKKSSSDVDVHLITKNEDVFVVKDNQVTNIYESPKEYIKSERFSNAVLTQGDLVTDNEDTTIVDVMDESDYQQKNNIPYEKQSRSSVSTATNYAMINWSIRETQTTLPWCAAYVTAAILNNKVDTRPALAQDVMNHAYPGKNQAFKEANSLSRNQAVAYGKARGTNPISINSTLSHSMVEGNLRKGNAIYVGSFGYGNTSKSRHAFALYGWVTATDNSYKTYYMWNPWWNYPMVVQANTTPITIPVPGGGFVWDVTIYNW